MTWRSLTVTCSTRTGGRRTSVEDASPVSADNCDMAETITDSLRFER
jgi:hypothetical protein